MSAGFDLAVIGAPLKQLWLSYFSSAALFTLFSVVYCMLLCCLQQGYNLFFASVSMRLRAKRTCSGDFHIKQRFFYLLIFLRGDFT
ncbi:hypothetical protein ACOSQ2_018004 [Xanthoceras sorbifolium]